MLATNCMDRPARAATHAIPVALLLCAQALSAHAQQLETTRAANLRKGPSTSSAVITPLDSGTPVQFLSKRARYDRVRTADGTNGWIYAPLLRRATVSPDSTGVAPAPPATPGGSPTSAPSAYHNCPINGIVSPKAHNPAALKALNVAKNRFHAPTTTDIDPTFTLSALLKPGNDVARFNATKAGELEGVVVNVKVGGIETGNCKAIDTTFRDTHIEVATNASAPETQRIIVEVTPRWRAAMKAVGIDWSTQGLQSLIGKRVKFRGWQLFDEEHRGQAKNTAPANPKDWRATAWELHPVTSFVVVSP